MIPNPNPCRPPRRLLQRLVFALLAVSGLACGGDAAPRFGSIGTAGTGGIYYPLGGTLARLLSEALPGSRFTAEVTGGSVENLNRVARGEMDLGMAIGTTLTQAASGPDADDYAGVRVVAPLYPNLAHVLVSRQSTLGSIGDAAGASVSVGAPGSGTEQMARDVLRAHGLEVEQVQARYLSFTESSAALRDGAVQLAILSVGYPAAAVLEATTSAGARLLPLTDAARTLLLDRHPHYRAAELPVGVYPGVEQPVPTVSVLNWIVGDETLDGDTVRALLEILRLRRDDLASVNEVAGRIELDALADAPLPLHAAAAEWLAANR